MKKNVWVFNIMRLEFMLNQENEMRHFLQNKRIEMMGLYKCIRSKKPLSKK